MPWPLYFQICSLLCLLVVGAACLRTWWVIGKNRILETQYAGKAHVAEVEGLAEIRIMASQERMIQVGVLEQAWGSFFETNLADLNEMSGPEQEAYCKRMKAMRALLENMYPMLTQETGMPGALPGDPI